MDYLVFPQLQRKDVIMRPHRSASQSQLAVPMAVKPAVMPLSLSLMTTLWSIQKALVFNWCPVSLCCTLVTLTVHS